MERLILMLAGLMQVPAEILEAARRPLFSHRSPRFEAFRDRLRVRMKPLFGTATSEVLFMSGSGTAAMESAVVNLTSPCRGLLCRLSRWTSGRSML